MELRKVEVTLRPSGYIFENGRQTSKRTEAELDYGHFHCFEHYKDKTFSGVLAIIEMKDGTIRQFEINQIRFLDKPTTVI